MSYIYRPAGKALEYCDLALNLYRGCSHGCKYCYAPSALFVSREIFKENPKPREFIFSQLTREMEKNRGKSVLMCFSCDPYQPIETELNVTRRTLEHFLFFGIHPVILTKGGRRSTRDFGLLAKDPQAKYGATLTFLDESLSLQWEPGAALPQERIQALKEAHSLGIQTWASLEPVIEPEQSLEIIRQTHEFVDEYKVGRWNHDSRANAIDWKSFAEKAVALCQRFGKRYYIKKDLACFLNPVSNQINPKPTRKRLAGSGT